MSITATIKSNGNPVSSEYHIMSIDVIKEVNKIPTAQIIVLDGDAAQQKFEISDSKYFAPGEEIEILLRYDSDPDKTVFKGIIVRHRVKADKNGSYLTLDLKDAAFRLTTTRKSAVFPEGNKEPIKDDEIIKNIIKNAGGGLTIKSVEATTIQHERMVQYHCSDWDFILSRTDANGQWVLVDDGNITVTKPKFTVAPMSAGPPPRPTSPPPSLSTTASAGPPPPTDSPPLAPKRTFEYGIDVIYDLEMETDIRQQVDKVTSTDWDPKQQQMLKPIAAIDFKLQQGKTYDSELAASLGSADYSLVAPVDLSDKEGQAWADATLQKSRLSMLKGHLKVDGDATIKPGDLIDIQGIGDRFNGKTLVTAVRHQVSEQGWQTDVQFGLSADWYMKQREDIIATPASGLLPAINGLHIGRVVDFQDDPEKQFRVQVNVPAIDDKAVVWARMATLYASKDRGIFFWPEKDDEVLLGFLNDDPRQAIILGALPSESNTPFEDSKPTKENSVKSIVVKNGSFLRFGDEDKKASIELLTQEQNGILLDDEDKVIFIKDQHGNEISMNKDGIEITSVKDIKVDASSGKVEISGQKMEMK